MSPGQRVTPSSTVDAAARPLVLLTGLSGAGKTCLIPTLPTPLVISAEGGLLSIAGADVPYIEVNSYDSLMEAYRFVAESQEAAAFQSIAVDSISEIAELVLPHEKRTNKDGSVVEYFQLAHNERHPDCKRRPGVPCA